MQIYTDDPIGAVVGTQFDRDLRISTMLSLWMALGLGVAFHKATRGKDVIWIGARYLLGHEQLTVSITPELVDELTHTIENMMDLNAVKISDVRRLAGQANHVAGLVFAWRPSLKSFWAALKKVARHPGRLQGRIWRRQIDDSLHWLLAFLTHRRGTLVRCYALRHHFNECPPSVIAFDASALGLGAILLRDGTVTHFLSDPIGPLDEAMLGVAAGDENGQQLWEALALLVALRAWREVWSAGRSHLTMEGDSMTALYMLLDVTTRSDINVTIAREIALELGSAIYRPDCVRHVPGITNKVPDYLSRCMAEPIASQPWPAALRTAQRVFPAPRDASWYLALRPPRRPRRRNRA